MTTNPNRTDARASALPLVLLAAAGAFALPALAEDEGTVKHYSDSSNERVPASTAFPAYPSVARRDRIEGDATVCFHIDSRGRVVRPAVRSSSHKIFERPALRAIKRSSFAPLPKGEKASPVKTCRTYRFRLEPVTAHNQ